MEWLWYICYPLFPELKWLTTIGKKNKRSLLDFSFSPPWLSHLLIVYYSIKFIINYLCDGQVPSHYQEGKETKQPFPQRHQQANGNGQRKEDIKTFGVTRNRLHIRASSFVNILLKLSHAEKKYVAGVCQRNSVTKKIHREMRKRKRNREQINCNYLYSHTKTWVLRTSMPKTINTAGNFFPHMAQFGDIKVIEN